MNPATFWTDAFKFGFYDNLMPVNYDRSLEEAFHLLAPKPKDHIIDFGCGNGRLMLHAYPWVNGGGTILGIDIDDDGMDAAKIRARRLKLHRVSFIRNDIRYLKGLTLDHADGAIAHFSIYTIPHESERAAALKNLNAILKPGAKAVVSVPSENYQINRIITDAKKVEDNRTDISKTKAAFRKNFVYPFTARFMKVIEKALDNNIFHRFTAEEITQNMLAAGFENVQVIPTYGGCGYHAVGTKRALSNT